MTRQAAFAFAAPPGQPAEIVTDSGEAFLAVCRRAQAGELVIEAVEQGDGPGQWRFSVRYNPAGQVRLCD